MLSAIVNACKSFFHRIKETIKKFTKPTTAVLTAGAMSDITRSRKDLVAENAILRQQLIVLKRQVKRPKFTNGDRLHLILLSRLTQFWISALHLVQPQTLLRWHLDLFPRYWLPDFGCSFALQLRANGHDWAIFGQVFAIFYNSSIWFRNILASKVVANRHQYL